MANREARRRPASPDSATPRPLARGDRTTPAHQLESLTSRIIAASAALENFHHDPADQLIVATAHGLGLPLVTVIERIRVWDGRDMQRVVRRSKSKLAGHSLF